MTEAQPIYLDHAATCPTDRRVVEAMIPYMSEYFGNPSSVYRLGSRSQEAITRARESIANLLGASSRKEIIFTSGGSESINLAIRGVALAQRDTGRGRHVITDAIEHHATLHAVEHLTHEGFETTVLPVDSTGRVSVADLTAAIRPDTCLVSIMYANNEIGTVQPIAELGAVCRERNIPLHLDAVQAVGALPLDVNALHVDLVSISGHKFYGPKGTGLLYIREGTPLQPQIFGGGQESKRRAGTENVPGIIGIEAALRLALDEMESATAHCKNLRDYLLESIRAKIPYAHLNGHPTERLSNNIHLTFDFLEGNNTTDSLLSLLDAENIWASTGSACNSRALEPSHVLKAIGLDRARAFSSVRFTMGRENTMAQMERVASLLPGMIDRLRRASPSYHKFIAEGGRAAVS